MHDGNANVQPMHGVNASGAGAVAIGGNVAGANISTNIYNPYAPSQRIAHLIECFQHELENNIQAQEILDDLRRIKEPKVSDPQTLEEKLTDGDREDQISFAIESKQEFVKKLARFELYASAQQIHYYVLATIYTTFTGQIRPLIAAKRDRDEIEQAIQYRIITPILADLQINPFGYTPLEIMGMVYFLTGTCKIRWN